MSCLRCWRRGTPTPPAELLGHAWLGRSEIAAFADKSFARSALCARSRHLTAARDLMLRPALLPAQVSPAFFMFFLQAEHTMSHCARSKRF